MSPRMENLPHNSTLMWRAKFFYNKRERYMDTSKPKKTVAKTLSNMARPSNLKFQYEDFLIHDIYDLMINIWS